MKHRVVSVGDARNATRIQNVMSQAIHDAGVPIDRDQSLALAAAFEAVAQGWGLVLAWQVKP